MTRGRIRRLLLRAAPLALVALIGADGTALGKTDIEFWHGLAGVHGERTAELARRFNASQDAYEVKPVFKGSYPEVFAAVIAAYRSKNPPHIAQVFEVGTQTMLLSGAIVPVFELMREQGMTIHGASFLEPVRTYYSKDAQLYAMPFNSSTAILYYNKDVFRRAGLDPGRAPATFDEIEAAATRIMATGTAKCGFSHAWPSWSMVEMMHAWHDQPFADQQNGFAGLSTRLLINGQLGTRVWETLARWRASGLYTYAGRGRNGDTTFTGGQCAMLVTGTSLIGALHNAGFDWGTGQMPRVSGYPQGSAIVGGATLWVMRGHRPVEYQGVARFLEFISRPDQQAWWHRVTGYLPISHEALRQLQAEQWFVRHPNHFTAFDQISSGTNTSNTQGIRIGNYQAVRDAIEGELENMLAGRKAPRLALDDAVKRGNELLQEFAALYK